MPLAVEGAMTMALAVEGAMTMALRAVNGMHWSNDPQWDNEQALRAIGDAGALTALHFQLFPTDPISGLHGEDENCLWYGKWRYGFPPQGIPARPEMLIHLRLYHQDWRQQDPVRLAEQAAELLANWRGSRDHSGLTANLWDDPYLVVSPCNEQDIEPAPPGDLVWRAADYERYARWQLAWLNRLDQLVPNRKALTMTGAFAGGHDPIDGPAPVPDGEYQVGAVREMLHAFDAVGVHCYAHLHHPERLSAPWQRDAFWYSLRPWRPVGHKNASDVGGLITQYPNLTYFFSEIGTWTHSDKGRTGETYECLVQMYQKGAASGNVIGMTPFLWHSGAEHKENRIWPNEELRQRLENAPRYTTSARVPLADAPPVQPPVEEVPVSEANPYGYIVGDGFTREAERLGWTLLSDEIYHDPADRSDPQRTAFSEAFCDKGRLYYHARAGVQAVPFA